MTSISKTLMVIGVLLSTTYSFAQIKNAKTTSVKIYGNCEMCEANIEKAGSLKNIAIADWNQDTKMAMITYNSDKTNEDEILKRIALAGYDSQKFLAPDDVYAKLPECCQYQRVKPIVKIKDNEMGTKSKPNIHDHGEKAQTNISATNNISQLRTVFDLYFKIKDALVKTDGNSASAKARALLEAVNTIQMNKLSTAEHTVWMKIMKDLTFDAGHISDTKDVEHQRDHFMSLSKNIYELIKVSPPLRPVYYQHCPMYNNGKGANWLSEESAVKNPYYGSKMLTCGKTVETIK